MRYASALTCLTICLVLADASAQDSPLGSSCPTSPGASPLRYSRFHQIATVAPLDDPTHTVVTPGGMVLSSPKMVAATDVLTIAARDTNAMCFHLLTFARQRHTCAIQGVARMEKDGAYVFRENLVVVRFKFIAEDQVTVEPLGNGYRDRCEPSGKIERAIYTSSGER